MIVDEMIFLIYYLIIMSALVTQVGLHFEGNDSVFHTH